MVTILEEKKIGTRGNVTEVVADLNVSTSSELPGPTAINGRYLAQGSLALVIQEASLYALDADGIWYKQEQISTINA